MLYMALHIADPEVSALMTEYVKATGMTKTEALRRLLRHAVQEVTQQETRKQRRAKFREIAYEIMEKARQQNQPPHTKEEADALFEGTAE
jgi:hypothetical protein